MNWFLISCNEGSLQPSVLVAAVVVADVHVSYEIDLMLVIIAV